MKRQFRAPLLFVVLASVIASLFVAPCCHPSSAAALRTRIVCDQGPDEVYIHIRSDRQAGIAIRIREKLIQDGYLVPRTIMVSFGPHKNQVRYFHDDRARAESIAHELKGIGLTTIAIKRIGHYQNNPRGRYELWLAPYAR